MLRLLARATILLMAVAWHGCGKPFNVKSRTALPPANYSAKAAVESVGVQAQVLTDEDFLYDTFDANLIGAGILPVRVMLVNSGAQSVDLNDARFEVRSQTGPSFRASKADRAFKRLISYYEISTYSKSGYKESKGDFSGHALDTKTPLAAGQARQGLLFFLMPSEGARGHGLVLVVSRLGSKQSGNQTAVELKLN